MSTARFGQPDMQKLQMVASALPMLRREAITELITFLVSLPELRPLLAVGQPTPCLTKGHPHTRLISAILIIENPTNQECRIDLKDAHNLQTIRNDASILDYALSPSGITTVGRDHRLAWVASRTLRLVFSSSRGTFQASAAVQFVVDSHDLYEGLSGDDGLTGYLGSQRGAGAGTPA